MQVPDIQQQDEYETGSDHSDRERDDEVEFEVVRSKTCMTRSEGVVHTFVRLDI